MKTWPTATEAQRPAVAAVAGGRPPGVRIDSWPVLLRRTEFRLWGIDPSAISLQHVHAGIPPLAEILPPNEMFLPRQRWNILVGGRAAPLAASMLVIGAGVTLDCERLFEPVLVLSEEYPGSPFSHFNLSLTPTQSIALISDCDTVLDALVWCDFDDGETKHRWRTFNANVRQHRPRVAVIPMDPIQRQVAAEALLAVRNGKNMDDARDLYLHTIRAIEDAVARRIS